MNGKKSKKIRKIVEANGIGWRKLNPLYINFKFVGYQRPYRKIKDELNNFNL